MKYSKYPEIVSDPDLEFVQNKVPKIDAETKLPGEWAKNPNCEWCPPATATSTRRSRAAAPSTSSGGRRQVHVRVNSDNLGATLAMEPLTYFAEKDLRS